MADNFMMMLCFAGAGAVPFALKDVIKAEGDSLEKAEAIFLLIVEAGLFLINGLLFLAEMK